MRIRSGSRAVAVTLLVAAFSATSVGASQAAAPQPYGPDQELPPICRQSTNVICVSKTDRKLRYLEAGREWLTAEVRFGRPGFETPTGTWTIETKAPNRWWSHPYKVYMPWGMVFDSRIGLYIHYSSGFALNPATYVGSHGCVQLGDWEKTRALYERVPVGTTVHIY